MTGFNYQPQNGHSKLFLQPAENLGEFLVFFLFNAYFKIMEIDGYSYKTEISNTQMQVMYEKSNTII
jgi:hypothetical protein